MKTFRVYFSDGNQKLYEALNMMAVLNHIAQDLGVPYEVGDIVKIEEVEA